MVRIYCQYSYGGFKNFPIEGKKDELLDKEVSNNDTYDFPTDANIFFSYGGIKMVYRQLENGEYTLVIKEIPSAHTDSDGRPIICAVQFIGGEKERLTLDNMAISIANDINSFEAFFKDLFFEQEGLRLEGDKLRAYINSFNADYVFSGSSKLLNIPKSNVRVFLLVALSSNFGPDKIITEKVLNELNLRQDTKRGETVIMTYQQLLNQQGDLIIRAKEEGRGITPFNPSNPSAHPAPSTGSDGEITSLKNRCTTLETEQTNLSNQFARLLRQHNNSQHEFVEAKKYIRILTWGFGLLVLIQLIELIF